ncbi:MAG: Undecaprenyl phosphate-aminoarabinose flippase subunit ArnF [Candidatus Accumulibacter sp. BA-94]|jgi:drug/metabolite transporter (DMT)-like permease|uniref:EamA family transporter n=1 Tax=Accumulibacter sp. TaxID=2053492 RepID=UPI00044F7C90|nr:EamA family transporter [Accumulibacter sp.]EXI86011.1 MAG: Undecaprenyl phosphate-aminoarabinose flippase subunit ArnF [Candidatus Accumulibacter sp. BA-94]MBL8391951.1 EamA family transporter [Accumulibacter sp.]HRD87358.1 EamA family transporter [Accumulibacter sp.]
MHRRIDIAGHVYIALTLLFTVYGQLVLKWQMSHVGPLPDGTLRKLQFLLLQFLNPWIMTGLASAFLASLAWMAAMTRLDLNYAYPFMSLAFVIVMAFSVLFLHEALSLQRIMGTFLVVTGLVIMAR